jgi:hypothetical protein
MAAWESASGSPCGQVYPLLDDGALGVTRAARCRFGPSRDDNLVSVVSRQGVKSSDREEDSMKFMFMIYHDENVLDALPEGEMQVLVDSALDYDDEIRRSGHYVVSEALQPARTARTIRVGGGKVSTTDGPFAETKEQLGGFFLIEARDMDEACEVAARFPPARLGIIEVRPVQELRHS